VCWKRSIKVSGNHRKSLEYGREKEWWEKPTKEGTPSIYPKCALYPQSRSPPKGTEVG
jgi:hypothetical protein